MLHFYKKGTKLKYTEIMNYVPLRPYVTKFRNYCIKTSHYNFLKK